MLRSPVMGDTILESARSVARVAQRNAAKAEQAGVLDPDVLDCLAHTDLLRMAMPAAAGGPEIDPVTSAEAIMLIAEGDASAAWYPAVSSATSLFAHYLPEGTAREIFDDTAPVGSVGVPYGTGTFDDHGLRVDSGRWPWASTAPVANWMGIGLRAEERTLLVFVPASDVRLCGDWNAHGLRATASGAISVPEGTAVAQRRILELDQQRPHTDTALTRFPMTAYATLGFAAVALGNALGAVNEFVDLATAKTPLGAPNTLAESAHAQLDLARAEARLHSARAFYLATLDSLWQHALHGTEPSTRERSRTRLAMTHAAAESAAVIDALYPLGGGSVVFDTHPLQRRLRDAHVITQQVQVSGRIYPIYGKIRLGVPVDEASMGFAT